MTGNSLNGITSFMQAIPKVELHLHIEGAIPLELLLDFILREGTDPSVKNIDDLRQKFVYTDFMQFLRLWNWKNTFITQEQDFARIACHVLQNLVSQNVKYVELFYSPGGFCQSGLSVAGITECLINGMEEARKKCGIDSRLIVDLVRDLGPESGMQVLDEVTPYLGEGLIGVGIGGSEADYPAELFEDVYRKARKRGFRLTAHAGEAAGAPSIRAAIDNLGAERIGHGVRANEDPELVTFLKKSQIPLEMCIISNVKTGVCASIKEHPIKDYADRGLMLTVNSDDPVMFHTSITQEYLTLYNDLDFSIDEIRQLSMNGIEASFMPTADKKSMKARFENEWEKLLTEYAPILHD